MNLRPLDPQARERRVGVCPEVSFALFEPLRRRRDTVGETQIPDLVGVRVGVRLNMPTGGTCGLEPDGQDP